MIASVSKNVGYDVVLVDIELAAKDGSKSTLEATKELRQIGYSAERLPILALTAASPRDDYYMLGLNDWLTKPMLIKNIQAAMTNAICNVGTAASSVCTGSVFTDTKVDTDNRSTVSRGRPLPPSRQASFGSVYSAFSKHLLAMSTPLSQSQSPKKPGQGPRSLDTSTSSASMSLLSTMDPSPLSQLSTMDPRVDI